MGWEKVAFWSTKAAISETRKYRGKVTMGVYMNLPTNNVSVILQVFLCAELIDHTLEAIKPPSHSSPGGHNLLEPLPQIISVTMSVIY